MEGGAVCAIFCYFAFALAGVIMFGCAFSTLEQNHVGLKFNSITRTYDDTEVVNMFLFGATCCDEFVNRELSIEFATLLVESDIQTYNLRV